MKEFVSKTAMSKPLERSSEAENLADVTHTSLSTKLNAKKSSKLLKYYLRSIIDLIRLYF